MAEFHIGSSFYNQKWDSIDESLCNSRSSQILNRQFVHLKITWRNRALKCSERETLKRQDTFDEILFIHSFMISRKSYLLATLPSKSTVRIQEARYLSTNCRYPSL